MEFVIEQIIFVSELKILVYKIIRYLVSLAVVVKHIVYMIKGNETLWKLSLLPFLSTSATITGDQAFVHTEQRGEDCSTNKSHKDRNFTRFLTFHEYSVEPWPKLVTAELIHIG